MITEKDVLKEILNGYKNLPLLWDPNNKLHSNRRAREKAYKILLDKLQFYDKDATLPTLKKRIENMRTCVRKEYRKILEARKRQKEHHPSLWYYDALKFVLEVRKKEDNDALLDCSSENPDLTKETNEWELEMLQNDDEEDSPSESRKRKLGSFVKVDFDGDSWKADDIDEQYLKIKEDDIPTFQEDNLSFKEEERCIINKENNLNDKEAYAFGRTVGLQLRQLSKKQRTFAEKLISDVIFYGRLNELNMESSLHVTNI